MSDTTTALIALIDQRLSDIITRLHDGGDCPPAQQLRLEGLCEAAVLIGALSPAELYQRFEQQYLAITGRAVEASYGDHWRSFYSFPTLPLFAEPAPVYPTSSQSGS